MLIRVRAVVEYLRENLFFVPTVLLLAAAAAAQATISVDAWFTERGMTFPRFVGSTVESARSLLSTIAQATITFAAIATSISLLVMQLAASQFSPRVLYAFFRDPFTKWVVGFVVATFTYCLLVLRAVRQPGENGAEAVVPTISVLVATVLGIAAVLSVVALIHHTAQSMQISRTIGRITGNAREQVARVAKSGAQEGLGRAEVVPEPSGPHLVVEAAADGWVQQVDARKLLSTAPEGGVVKVETRVGAFVPAHTPIATVWPPPNDSKEAIEGVRASIMMGSSRTMQEDIGFAIRQLADISLRALSTGVNDPTTAEEAIVHIGSILRELLVRDLPPGAVSDEQGRVLLQPLQLSMEDQVELAFDQIRRSGAGQPAVANTLLRTIGMLVSELNRTGWPERAEVLRRQGALVLAQAEAAGILAEDLQAVREVAREQGLEPG